MIRCLTIAAVATGLALGAGRAGAADKAPDLSDLRDAIDSAAKRGNNVDDVRKAFEAFEKSLAKGFTAPKAGAPGPTPPELAALREAVEMAAKKGENVEEVAKELGLIEKAVTGREYERPKPPPPPKPPEPPPFRGGRPGVVIGGGRGIVVNGNFSSITITNGSVTLKARQDNVTYAITGQIGAEGLEVERIVITDGDKATEYKDVKKVPEQYRPTVEQLLKNIRGK
jgi:hypothetical protein